MKSLTSLSRLTVKRMLHVLIIPSNSQYTMYISSFTHAIHVALIQNYIIISTMHR